MTHLSPTEASELVLDSYVMHIKQSICTRCGCGERWSELNEVWIHPTKTRQTGFRSQRPAAMPLKALPIAAVEHPDYTIPVCSDCVHTYHAAPGAAIPLVSAQQWAETIKRKYAPPPAAEIKVARASQPKSNIVDFPAPTPDQL